MQPGDWSHPRPATKRTTSHDRPVANRPRDEGSQAWLEVYHSVSRVSVQMGSLELQGGPMQAGAKQKKMEAEASSHDQPSKSLGTCLEAHRASSMIAFDPPSGAAQAPKPSGMKTPNSE